MCRIWSDKVLPGVMKELVPVLGRVLVQEMVPLIVEGLVQEPEGPNRCRRQQLDARFLLRGS
jgi:hypothetical protein